MLPGTIQAYSDAPIYARTNGYVKAWYHDIGSHVHKGELLAVIETPELDRQVDEARASLNTAKANLGLAHVTAQRYEGLRGTEAVSKQSIDTATQTESAQAASVAVAQQSLNQLLEMQSFERVYAPFDGVITARNVDVGQLVDSGSNGGTGSSSNPAGNISTGWHHHERSAGIVPYFQHEYGANLCECPRRVCIRGSTRSEDKHRCTGISGSGFQRDDCADGECDRPEHAHTDGRSRYSQSET